MVYIDGRLSEPVDEKSDNGTARIPSLEPNVTAAAFLFFSSVVVVVVFGFSWWFSTSPFRILFFLTLSLNLILFFFLPLPYCLLCSITIVCSSYFSIFSP